MVTVTELLTVSFRLFFRRGGLQGHLRIATSGDHAVDLDGNRAEQGYQKAVFLCRLTSTDVGCRCSMTHPPITDMGHTVPSGARTCQTLGVRVYRRRSENRFQGQNLPNYTFILRTVGLWSLARAGGLRD